MWEEYLIKKNIGYSRKEIYAMPSEERKWFLERISEELERQRQGAETGQIRH